MKLRGWLIALCVMALMVGGLYGASAFNARHTLEEQRALLESAVYRALVTCYAVEGRYPLSLAYLCENYGVQVDEDRFRVFYSSFADNVMPSVRVVPLGEGGGR